MQILYKLLNPIAIIGGKDIYKAPVITILVENGRTW